MKLILATTLILSAGNAIAQDDPGAHFLSVWDLDSDGTVTLAEAQEQRTNVFNTFDENTDGQLDAAEYAVFDAHRAEDAQQNGMGHGAGAQKMHEGMAMTFNDVNADGSVALDEFLTQAEGWLALVDRNADGAVTQADFGPKA